VPSTCETYPHTSPQLSFESFPQPRCDSTGVTADNAACSGQAAASSGGPPKVSVLLGEIKSVSMQKGYGFIKCDYLQVQGLNDAFFLLKELRSFSVGEHVMFSVQFNEKGQPQASDLAAVDNFQGRIKSFDAQKGFGFIECDCLRHRGITDVFLHKSQMGRFTIGAIVNFELRLSNKGQLQAARLKAVESSLDASEVSQSEDPKQSEGELDALRDEIDAENLQGTIKSFNEQKGFGFIECPCLQERGITQDVFLHKSQVGPFQIGSDVTFSVWFDDKRQPRAACLRETDSLPSASGAAPLEETDPLECDPEPPPTDLALKNLRGRIKSFNEQKGFGFIECNYLKEQGIHDDVFLHKSRLGSFHVGSAVTFSVAFNDRGQRQAADLKAIHEHHHSDTDVENLQGIIKSFNAETGFGFIECEYLRAHGIHQDVFLHKSQLGPFQQGSLVNFSLRFNNNKPQAANLRLAEEAQQRREQLNTYLNQDHVCVVCQTRSVGIVYTNCHHGCLCRECSAESSARPTDTLEQCPVCRTAGPRAPLFLS